MQNFSRRQATKWRAVVAAWNKILLKDFQEMRWQLDTKLFRRDINVSYS